MSPEPTAQEIAAYNKGWEDCENDLFAGLCRIGIMDDALHEAERGGMRLAAEIAMGVEILAGEEPRKTIVAAILAAARERDGEA